MLELCSRGQGLQVCSRRVEAPGEELDAFPAQLRPQPARPFRLLGLDRLRPPAHLGEELRTLRLEGRPCQLERWQPQPTVVRPPLARAVPHLVRRRLGLGLGVGLGVGLGGQGQGQG